VIPVSSESDSGRATITWVFALLLSIIALYQWTCSGSNAETFRTFGLVPIRLLSKESWSLIGPMGQTLPLFSHVFIHDGLAHVGLNLWFLLVFGPPTERWLGPVKYFLCLLVLAAGPALGDVFIRWTSVVPLVGASGLISGLMGLYLVRYPRAKLRTLLPLAVPIPLPIPVPVFMCAWLGLQSLLAYANSGVSSRVAWWAHMVGFALGICVGIMMRLMNPGQPVVRQTTTH
jgi:membrane associated rhomboid family serine protease